MDKHPAVAVLWILASCCVSQSQAAAAPWAHIETPLSYNAMQADEVGLRTILISPENTAVVAGESATLHCASNFSTLTWASSPTGNPPYTRIVSECVLNPELTESYALANVGPNRCDLVLINAAASQAIVHHCIETFGFDPAQSVLIAVLDSEPQCSMDNTDPRINDEITLTCSVSYTDNISPVQMFWTDESGEPVALSRNAHSAGHTNSSLSLQ
jgi:hypothetical protein